MPLYQQIKDYYYYSDRDFEEDLQYHCMNDGAVIHITSEHLLLARPVCVRNDTPLRHIINPAHDFPREKCNAWHIHLMIGPPAPLARLLHHNALQYPFIVFQRGYGRTAASLHIYKTTRLLTRLNCPTPHTNKTTEQ